MVFASPRRAWFFGKLSLAGRRVHAIKTMKKIVVFVPDEYAERVKDAMFDAGAGAYELYERCCWQSSGTGQFMPRAGSNPHIGTEGRLETVSELRIEMLCADELVAAVVAALNKAHPYESPAFEVSPLELWESCGAHNASTNK